MCEEEDQNRNEWAQLGKGEFPQSTQQHGYVLNGYASGAHSEGSDYSDSNASSYGSSKAQGSSDYDGDHGDIPEEEVREFVKTPTQPKQGQPKSKRSQRREKVMKENGDVGSSDLPKGLVEWQEGVFMWWDSENNAWLPAAYHDEFRAQFIEEDATEGTYVIAPERGQGIHDVTTFCAAFNQGEWRLEDRESFGNIVDADQNKVLYLLKRPLHQSYDPPERLWIHNGYVLLDGDNNPVRPWAGIPRCFSSKIEGGRIEALRRILPITIQDIRARCMREVPTAAGHGAPTKPLSLPSTFGHRSSRFRAMFQCPTWLPRAASDVVKKFITDQLPEAEEATTTEGLQILTRYEIERRKSTTRGQYLYKASGRAISEEERKERDRKLADKLARQAAKQPQTPQVSRSMPATPEKPLYPDVHLRTPPLSAGNKRRRVDDDHEYFDVRQPEPAPKRRYGASPFDPRMQGRFPEPSVNPEDPFRQQPSANNASTTVSVANPRDISNAIGLGSDLGGYPVVPQNSVPSPHTNASESAPQQPEASSTTATVSAYGPQIPNLQPDYRFVIPQTPLDQLRIQAALFYPRAHYYALIGEHPPHTCAGSYAEQCLQIRAHLAQKWLLPDRVPELADIGPIWNGSFDQVPIPTLSQEVLWMILHPIGEASHVAGKSAAGQIAQVGSVIVGGGGFQTGARDEEVRGAKVKVEDWEDDLFGGFVEGGDADEDLF